MGNPEKMPAIEKENNGEDYEESAIINGIEISVARDDESGDYIIRLPRAEKQNEENSKQTINVGKESSKAKEIFDKAVVLAEAGLAVFAIYQKLKQ